MTNKVAKKDAIAEVVQRSGHENPDGKWPVRIRVTYNRQVQYYPVKFDGTSLYMLPVDFQKIYFGKDEDGKAIVDKKGKPIKLKGEDLQKKNVIDAAKNNAVSYIKKVTENGQQFTFARFESEYLVKELKVVSFKYSATIWKRF